MTQIYNFEDRNIMIMTMDFKRDICSENKFSSDSTLFMIMNISTFVLAIISIILILKYISEISTMYKELRNKFVELDGATP